MKRMMNVMMSGALTVVGLTLSGGNALAQHYVQTNLVSDNGVAGTIVDPLLVNPWGLARSSGSPWWVADNHTGVTTLYDGSGNKQTLVVSGLGAPTGAVFNPTPDFVLPDGLPATFMFASEDGNITAWNGALTPNTQAIVVVKRPKAIYKGLALASFKGKNYIYATDFHNAKVDVFDTHFHQAFTFTAGAANGMAPFGIQNIGGSLIITLAP